MSEKRKDSKGRILKTGESQRKDGSYMFRFTDIRNTRRCIYALTLDELREKEKTIQIDLNDGIDYAAGEITVTELVKRYVGQKQGRGNKTQQGYKYVLNLLSNEDFGCRKIRTVKPSDGKAFFIKLHNDGRGHSTIVKVQSIVKPAFAMAIEDDILRRNPFSFPLKDVIPNDVEKREALSEADTEDFLSFVQKDTCSQKYYSEIMILLGTGLRASEFCGLTMNDVDLQERRIKVDHQLLRDEHGTYYISKPKTSNGMRYIPMNNEVYTALQNIINNRKPPKVEYMIDGYVGFLFLDRSGKPKTVRHLDNVFKNMVKRYNNVNSKKIKVTPHILRHTFCTRLENSGMNPKSIQYLMGHGDLNVTMGTYAHSDYETAEKAFLKMFANG